MFKLTVLVILLFTSPIIGFTQSKTDKVEDKLKGKETGDASGSSSANSMGEGAAQFIMDVLFSDFFLWWFYIEKDYPTENYLTYNPYPYYPYGYDSMGLRNYNSTKNSAFTLSLDLSRPPLIAWDTNYGFSAEYSHGYWGLHSAYRIWDEVGANTYRHQFNFAIERKLRYFPNAEAGFLLGFERTTIKSNPYKGFLVGFESDYYWFKPVSIQFNWRGTIYENTTSNFIQTGLRYHFQQSAIVLNYQSLNFGGIIFRGINLGYAVWF